MYHPKNANVAFYDVWFSEIFQMAGGFYKKKKAQIAYMF